MISQSYIEAIKLDNYEITPYVAKMLVNEIESQRDQFTKDIHKLIVSIDLYLSSQVRNGENHDETQSLRRQLIEVQGEMIDKYPSKNS
jgi:hypothetical protein